MVLRGGGVPNLEVIQNEVYKILAGRAQQIRDFLGKLDTFASELNQQRDDIVHAIDSTDRILALRGQALRHDRSGSDRISAVWWSISTNSANLFADTVEAVGRVSNVTDQTFRAREAICIRICKTCSGRSSNSAGPRRIWWTR